MCATSRIDSVKLVVRRSIDIVFDRRNRGREPEMCLVFMKKEEEEEDRVGRALVTLPYV